MDDGPNEIIRTHIYVHTYMYIKLGIESIKYNYGEVVIMLSRYITLVYIHMMFGRKIIFSFLFSSNCKITSKKKATLEIL